MLFLQPNLTWTDGKPAPIFKSKQRVIASQQITKGCEPQEATTDTSELLF
jgi:hypothetical protein